MHSPPLAGRWLCLTMRNVWGSGKHAPSTQFLPPTWIFAAGPIFICVAADWQSKGLPYMAPPSLILKPPKPVGLRRGRYGKCKGWIRVLHLRRGVLLSLGFSHKMALVTCPCPFDWASSQKCGSRSCPGWGAAFSPENSHIKRPSRHVHLHFDCAGSRKVWVPALASSWGVAFSLRILACNGSCEMSMCISTAQARTK